MEIYYEKDTELSLLQGKKIAIIGFGSQGHAQALNLSATAAWKSIVAERPGVPNYDLAKQYGFEPVSAAEAAEAGRPDTDSGPGRRPGQLVREAMSKKA